MHDIIRSLVLSAVLLTSTVALSQSAPNVVEGTVLYDRQPTPILHVHARQVEDVVSDTPDPSMVKIMLTDKPLSDHARASESEFRAEVSIEQLRAVLLEVERNSGAIRTISISHPQGGGSSFSGTFDQFELSDFKVANGIVSGRVRTRQTVEFEPAFRPDVDDPVKSFAFDLRFQAPVALPVAPKQILSGAAAKASPQAEAAVATMALLNAGDIVRIRAGLHPSSRFANQFDDAAEGRNLLQQLKRAGILMPGSVFRARIQRVIDFGDRAAVVSGDRSNTITMPVTLTNGVWHEGGATAVGD